MNILNDISLTEGSGCVVLFYYTVNTAVDFDAARGTIRTRSVDIAKKHCEIFQREALKSVSLNENSFVLRFDDRNGKTPRSLKLTLNSTRQVDTVAQLIEFCKGEGLKVKQYYANISVKQTIQKK